MCFNCNLPGLHDEDFVPMVESSAIFLSPLPKLCLVAVAFSSSSSSSSSSSTAHLEQSSREKKSLYLVAEGVWGVEGLVINFLFRRSGGLVALSSKFLCCPKSLFPMHFPGIFGKRKGEKNFLVPSSFSFKNENAKEKVISCFKTFSFPIFHREIYAPPEHFLSILLGGSPSAVEFGEGDTLGQSRIGGKTEIFPPKKPSAKQIWESSKKKPRTLKKSSFCSLHVWEIRRCIHCQKRKLSLALPLLVRPSRNWICNFFQLPSGEWGYRWVGIGTFWRDSWGN